MADQRRFGVVLNGLSIGVIFFAGLTVFAASGYYDDPLIISRFSVISTEFFIISNLFAFGLPIAETAQPKKNTVDIDGTFFVALFYATFAAIICYLYLKNDLALPWLEQRTTLRFLLIPAIFIAILNKQLLSFFARDGRELEFGALNLSRYFMFAFTLFYLHFVGSKNFEYAFLVGEATAFAIIFGRLKKSINFENIILKAKTGIGLFLSPLVFDLNMKVDYIFILFLLGEEAIALYAIASFALEGLNQIAVASHVFLNHRIKRLKKHHIYEKFFKKYILLHFLISSILSAAAIVGIYVLTMISGQMEHIFAIIAVGAILVVGFVLSPMTNSFYYALAMQKELKLQNFVQFLLISLNVTLNMFLIPIFGILGAAIAASSAAILSNMVAFFLFRNRVFT